MAVGQAGVLREEQATDRMTEYTPHQRHVTCSLVGLVLLALVTGCEQAGPARTPEVIGIIASVRRTNESSEVTLRDGKRVRVDVGRATELESSQTIEVGSLWMSGTDGNGFWYISLGRTGNEYLLYTNGYAQDRTIILANGLRLRAAPSFDVPRGPAASFRILGVSMFRLNAKGEVIGVN